MKKFIIGISLCLGLSVSAVLAHGFWLQPSQFFATVGDKINIQILVGEHFAGERSEGRKNRIIQYRHHTVNGTQDLIPSLTGDTYGDVPVILKAPGTHVFTFSNTPKFLAMRADSFLLYLLYLQEDGLDNVILARQQQGDTNKPSRELYQRCVKTMVQVGSEADGTFAKKVGMPLVIIPVKNSYAQRPGQTAEFLILFQNKPLTGALVRYWNLGTSSGLTEKQQRSNAQGRVKFPLKTGQNMVSLVRMVPSDDRSQADWISYWGSLTFGCR